MQFFPNCGRGTTTAGCCKSNGTHYKLSSVRQFNSVFQNLNIYQSIPSKLQSSPQEHLSSSKDRASRTLEFFGTLPCEHISDLWSVIKLIKLIKLIKFSIAWTRRVVTATGVTVAISGCGTGPTDTVLVRDPLRPMTMWKLDWWGLL